MGHEAPARGARVGYCDSVSITVASTDMRSGVNAATSPEIRLSSVEEIRTRGWHLIEQRFREMGSAAEGMSVDWEQYAALEAASVLITLAAEDGGELIGFSVAVLLRELHHTGLLCQSTVLFVAPLHRHGRVGSRLIAETERHAVLRGATSMRWHRGPHDHALGVLLGRRGYLVSPDIVYSRTLP